MQSFCAQYHNGFITQTYVHNGVDVFTGAPVLASVSKGVPGIFMDCHMMVAQPEKVCHLLP